MLNGNENGAKEVLMDIFESNGVPYPEKASELRLASFHKLKSHFRLNWFIKNAMNRRIQKRLSKMTKGFSTRSRTLTE